MTEHEHQWQMLVHLDGCHFFSSTYTCPCGARMEDYSEREPSSDSYAALWMQPDCDRCNELIEGAEPLHERELIET